MEQTLTSTQILGILALVIATFLFLIAIGRKEAKRTQKVYGSAVYSRLCMFADFVNKCGITLENYHNIQYELTIIKGLKEMEDCVFKHKVDEIVKNFERRFKQWISISDQLKPTN